MLTSEDIKNPITAEREVFATKGDITGLEQRLGQRVDVLTTLVDSYAKKADTYHQEMSVLMHRVDRMEDWIQKVAAKVGIKYA